MPDVFRYVCISLQPSFTPPGYFGKSYYSKRSPRYLAVQVRSLTWGTDSELTTSDTSPELPYAGLKYNPYWMS